MSGTGVGRSCASPFSPAPPRVPRTPPRHPRMVSMQYPETLPLQDKEVVLTFDDGPIPKNSNQVIQTLADNCVLATFFIIGQQARENPEGVRNVIGAGHK